MKHFLVVLKHAKLQGHAELEAHEAGPKRFHRRNQGFCSFDFASISCREIMFKMFLLAVSNNFGSL